MIKPIVQALVLAALFLGVAVALRYAEGAGFLGADAAKRTIQILIGLGLAAYANVMPKQTRGPRRSMRAETAAQAALRAGGWSMTLGGLAYAALWAFTPLAIADLGGIAVIATAMAVTLGYAVWCFAACRSAATPTGR